MPKKPTVAIKVRVPRRRTSETIGDTGIHKAHQPMMAELYCRAEAHLRNQPKGQRSKARDHNSDAHTAQVLQELEIHQIELEMQNAELREARNELEVMLEKSTDLYDFAPVGYLSVDDSGVILEANLTSAAMLDKERSQLVKRSLLGFMSPTSRPNFLTFLKQVFSGHRNQTCEALFVKQGGGTFWGSLRAASAIRRPGERKWCRVVIADISARKEAEEGLRESERRYRSLFDLVPVGVYSCNTSGVIQTFNGRAADLWGRAPASGDTDERFCGSFKLFRPDGSFMPHEQCPMAEVVSGKIPAVHDAEVLIERPDGSRITVIVNIRPLRNERGEVTGAINCFYDITERKQAAERIRLSEVRYRRLFEAAHDGVLLLDPGTRKITDANPFMTKLLGYSREQLVGKELFEIGLVKDEAASREMFRKLKRKHEVRYEDLPLESQKGRHQEVEVVANLYQENGHAVIQCNIRDITERTHAKIALSRLAAIVEFSDDAMIGKDLNGIITSWNEGAEKIFGYTAREMVGTSIMRLIPTARRHEEKIILGKMKRGKSLEHFETLRRTKDGRLIDVSVTVSPIKDATGKVIGASKVARDITVRKQAEEMLRQNEVLFSALIEQSPVGVYVVDARLCLRQVNPKALPVFSKVTSLKGRKLSEIMRILWPKKIAAEVLGHFRHTLKTGKPYFSPEFSERRRDIGIQEFYEWQIQRVTLPGGELGVVCFFSNITERKQAEETQRRLEVLAASNRKLEQEISRRQAVEESLKQTQEQQSRLLEQSRQMQEQLRHLSHQLLSAQEDERKRISRELHDVIAQTLTSINLRLTTLKREATLSPKGMERSIARTQELVAHSVDIVHQFARELRPTALDDLGLIPALDTFVKSFEEQTGIHVNFSVFPAVEKVNGDKRTVLYRVAQEALTNIARHAQASRAKVIIRKLDDAICLEITDNGKGFPADRVLQAKKNQRLGLLGMRERVQMVNGNLTVESTPGKHTSIRVQIPLAESGGKGFVPAAPKRDGSDHPASESPARKSVRGQVSQANAQSIA